MENLDKIMKNDHQNDTKIDAEIKKMPLGLAKLAQRIHCDYFLGSSGRKII